MSEEMDLPHPYLLFLGDTTEMGYAKTAFGLRDWAADRCVGEWSCGGATVTTDLPRLTPKEARARGARALVIGVANTGGVISDSWIPSLIEALESGLDIKPVITHRFAWREYEKGFAAIKSGDSGKVILDWRDAR